MVLDKIDIREIIVEHLETLRDYGTRRRSISDLLLFFGLPFIIAGASIWFGIRIRMAVVNGLLTAFSIFVGLLFNLLLLVVNFLQSTQGNSADRFLSVRIRLLREITANLSFAILVSLLLVGVGIVALVRLGKDDDPIHSIETFLLIVGSANFFLSLLMVLRRMYALLVNEFDRHKITR